jgi:hypothetical protein
MSFNLDGRPQDALGAAAAMGSFAVKVLFNITGAAL